MNKKFVKTPLNYTGNKFRILDQIQPYFPDNIKVMVDLFCGGATVGLNTDCDKVVFVDNDPMVIGLLKFFKNSKFETLLEDLEKIITKYNLSNSYRNGYTFYKQKSNDSNTNNGLKNYNTTGFYSLRNDYNSLKNKKTDKAFTMLYILLLYGFNNDIRFNSKLEYNLPIGKTDFNKVNVDKLKNFIDKINSIETEFICSSFDSLEVKELIDGADFVYMDPPYLITNAVYNESNKWNNNFEYKLLDFIDGLVLQGKEFVLSNVLTKKDHINEPLNYWYHKHKDKVDLFNIDYNYKSSSYNKKNRESKEQEIIIKLKRKDKNVVKRNFR